MTTDSLTSMQGLADAERAEWRATCDDLHERLATMRVESDRLIAKVDAADQRACSLYAALTAERKASKGLVAQVEELRGDLQWARSRVKCVGNAEGPCGWRGFGAAVNEWEDNGETPRCPACDEGCVEIDHAAEAHPEGANDPSAELRTIRDLVAPGNPQGTVVDAVRAVVAGRDDAVCAVTEIDRSLGAGHDETVTMAAVRVVAERDAAIARAEKAERTSSALFDDAKAEIATLRARVAELEARPVLTVEGDDAKRVLLALGGTTLPEPDRAEELARAFMNERAKRGKFMTWDDLTDHDRAKMTDAARAALSTLSPTAPAPAREPAEFTAATVEELAKLRNDVWDSFDGGVKASDHEAIRAVLARARIHAVTAEGLAEVAQDWLSARYPSIPSWSSLSDELRAKSTEEHAKLLAAASRKAG